MVLVLFPWTENKQQGLMMEDFQADSSDEVVISKQSVEKKNST